MPTLLHRLAAVGLVASLSLSAGCSSSSSSSSSGGPATALSYSDPAGDGWRLVRDDASTPTRLVLDLVGPAAVRTRGVGLNVSAPATVRFGTFAPSGLPVEDAGVYLLRSTFGDAAEPVALSGGVLAGHVLSVGAYQKDRSHPAQESGRPLLRIALELDPAAGLVAGDVLPLAVLKARAIPEDIGSVDDAPYLLEQKMRMTALDVAVGKLTAR